MTEREAPAATSRIEKLYKARKDLEKRQQVTVKAQKKFYNKSRTLKTFKKGEKVMLRAKYIRQLRPSVKLTDKYLGPFKIIKVVGDYS